MAKYLVSWVLNGTLNFKRSIVPLKGKMSPASFGEMERSLRKKHGKNLTVLSFSKFEREDLPVISVTAVRSGTKP